MYCDVQYPYLNNFVIKLSEFAAVISSQYYTWALGKRIVLVKIFYSFVLFNVCCVIFLRISV